MGKARAYGSGAFGLTVEVSQEEIDEAEKLGSEIDPEETATADYELDELNEEEVEWSNERYAEGQLTDAMAEKSYEATYAGMGKAEAVSQGKVTKKAAEDSLKKEFSGEELDVAKAALKLGVERVYPELQRIDREKTALKKKVRDRERAVGDHWGLAEVGDPVAEGVAYTSGKYFRPAHGFVDRGGGHVENNMRVVKTNLSSETAIAGIGRRAYAQRQVKNFSREDYPEVYRGMSVSKGTAARLESGSLKKVSMTGATALSFKRSVADEYSSSEWTAQTGGLGKIGVVFTVKRTAAFDKSIGMWHHDRNDYSVPAFEIVSGISALSVTGVSRRADGILEIAAVGE